MKKTLLITATFLINIFSSSQTYNFDQGVNAYNKGDIEKALEYFGREISDNPKAALAFYYRAIIYAHQDQNSFALKDINNAIKYFSSKEKKALTCAYKLRGDIYYKIDNYEKTFKDYAKALKLSKNDPEIYIDRAQIYFELREYSKAEDDYLKALKVDESLLVPYVGLGRNHLYQGNNLEAEKFLNQLVILSPEYAIGYKYRAMVYFEQKKYDRAIDDIFYCFLLADTDKGARSMFIKYSEKNYPLSFSKVNAQINVNRENEL